MKSKTILIKLNPHNYPLARVIRHLSDSQRRRFKQEVAREVRQTKYHFKKYGWDLDWELIKDEVFGTVFGHDLSTYLLASIMKAAKVGLSFKAGVAMLSKQPTSKRGRVTRKRGRNGSRSDPNEST
jgi:hypothetical protein